MTREEAIEVIKEVRFDINTKINGTTRFSQALEMAIKALETLEEFEKAQIITGGRLNGRTYAYKCGLKDGKRKELEQEPKTGYWKAFIHNAYHGTDEDGEPIWREVIVYHCSQCNRRTVIKEEYCPNCGADMREVEE